MQKAELQAGVLHGDPRGLSLFQIWKQTALFFFAAVITLPGNSSFSVAL